MRTARLDKQLPQPQGWKGFAQSERVKQLCSDVCNDMASRMFGYHLVKLGPLSSEIELSDCPIRHKVNLHSQGHSAQVKGLSTELPLQTNAVDAFFLSLELDFASDPHRILREIDHSITANGCLLLCCLNPFSLSGLVKMLPFYRNHPLKHARFFTPMRTKDWLHLLHYEILDERYFYHRSLFSKRDFAVKEVGENWAVRHLLPYFQWSGAFYCILARKQTIPMTKVRTQWAKKPKFVAVGAASRAARSSVEKS